jgi:hypothetical protein
MVFSRKKPFLRRIWYKTGALSPVPSDFRSKGAAKSDDEDRGRSLQWGAFSLEKERVMAFEQGIEDGNNLWAMKSLREFSGQPDYESEGPMGSNPAGLTSLLSVIYI